MENQPEQQANNRWYDRDPVLARALKQLRQAPDRYQAQIALNIIKIIIEHQIEAQLEPPGDGKGVFADRMDDILAQARNGREHHQYRRWYDAHETLSSAIQLLNDCPDDLQQRVIPSIAGMIEQTLLREAVD